MKALCSFYGTYTHPITPLEPAHIGTGNGLSAVLDHLGSTLCDPGEAFILPTPYYNAFDEDLSTRSQVELVAVKISEGEHGQLAEVERLDQEMQRRASEADAPAVRAVLLTNPHNPLGELQKCCCSWSRLTFDSAQVSATLQKLFWPIVAWPKSGTSSSSRTRSMLCRYTSLVSPHLAPRGSAQTDPLSALSDLNNPLPFTSILSLDVQEAADCNPARIIQLYGESELGRLFVSG